MLFSCHWCILFSFLVLFFFTSVNDGFLFPKQEKEKASTSTKKIVWSVGVVWANDEVRCRLYNGNKKQCSCVWHSFQTDGLYFRQMPLHNLQPPSPNLCWPLFFLGLIPLQHQLMVFKCNAKALTAHVERRTQQVSAAECLAFSWSCHNQSLALPAWHRPYSVRYCQMSPSSVGWQIRAQKSAQKGTRFIIKNCLPTLFLHTLSEWDL